MGDRWNCKCRLKNTDDEVTKEPAGYEVEKKSNQPAKGLDNNPGKDGELFSDDHSYFPKNCSICPKFKIADLASKKKKKNCYDCYDVEDVTSLLERLHSTSGADYNKTLQKISELKIFKKVPN